MLNEPMITLRKLYHWGLKDYSRPVNFFHLDTEKQFLSNCKTQDSAWLYRTRSVEYCLNDQGYRAAELAQIDWSNSIIMFGCSNLFGVGLDQKDTVDQQLSRLIAADVVNLSIPGGSLYMNYENLVSLLKKGIRPKGIVNVWTDYSRLTYFLPRGFALSLGSWEDHVLYRTWNQQDSNSQTYALMIVDSTRLLCESLGIWHRECSFFKPSAELFDCEHFDSVDTARDLMHPGIESAGMAAEYLANEWRNSRA